MAGTKIITKQISGQSITIVESDGVQEISFMVVSGVINVTGGSAFRGAASDAVQLATVGQSATVSSLGGHPIDGLVIQATGVAILLMKR